MGRFPLLIGGAGEKVTLGIVARYADAWSCWGTPAVFGAKNTVLDAHCARVGRDPGEVARVAHAQVVLCATSAAARRARRDVTRPERTLVGTPAEVAEAISGYADLGVSEFVVPDLAFGPPGERERLMDALLTRMRNDG